MQAQSDRPRNGRRRGWAGRGTQSSKHRKLAQKKAAAEGSRREHKGQEGWHSLGRPGDFEAHGRRRANGKLPMAEHRASVYLSPGGRRTSHGMARQNRAALAPVYPLRTQDCTAFDQTLNWKAEHSCSLKLASASGKDGVLGLANCVLNVACADNRRGSRAHF
jgi:hypothetical protein